MSLFDDISNFDFSNDDLSNVVTPRWKRKELAKTPKKTPKMDRFIPSRRSQEEMDITRYKLTCSKENVSNNYQQTLQDRLLEGKLDDHKILAFSKKAPSAPKWWQNNLRVLYSQNKIEQKKQKIVSRVISQTPERILDAPGLLDDYYLNLLDWSCENALAVALGNTVYVWNAETGGISKLMEAEGEENYVCSLGWIQDGSYLAIGTAHNEVQIWDAEAARKVRTMRGHQARVSSVAWNNHILSSGGRDGKVINHDVRIQQHVVAVLSGHEQEVCGLKWSADGTQLASGGNDNILNVWRGVQPMQPLFTLREHQAAVKAIAWCPWQSNLLASGGGTADRTIRFWNTQTGQCLNSVDTKSQVCSIIWSKHSKELVSSHGFSENQLIVWKYPTMNKIAELTGHTSRVLHLAQSPDGSKIVSAAGDETLRFWNVFAAPKVNTKKHFSPLSIRGMNIR